MLKPWTSGCLRDRQQCALLLKLPAFTSYELPHQHSCVPAFFFFSTEGSSKQPWDSGWINYWKRLQWAPATQKSSLKGEAFNRSCLTFSDVHNHKAATCPEQPYAPCFTENRQGASSISWPILKWHPIKNKLSMEILSSTRSQSWCLYSVFHSPLYSRSWKCCRSSRKTPMTRMTSSCHM